MTGTTRDELRAIREYHAGPPPGQNMCAGWQKLGARNKVRSGNTWPVGARKDS